MSIAARQALVSSPSTVFQAESQRGDLLDPSLTQTGLIALLTELVRDGHILLFTAVRSDHHDDSALGLHCHANGYCADLWPLHSTTPTDFINAGEPRFQSFLESVAESSWLYQVGLAGTADTEVNRESAGKSVFADDGADHVHLGSN